MNPNRLGDIKEYAAVQLLLSKGYEVFKNTASTGPVDLIAIKDNSLFLIDVKSDKQAGSDRQIEFAGLKLFHMYVSADCKEFQLIEARPMLRDTEKQKQNVQLFLEKLK